MECGLVWYLVTGSVEWNVDMVWYLVTGRVQNGMWTGMVSSNREGTEWNVDWYGI